MYGALLRPDTELTRSGEAHIGVLFMTNDGFSTMCGHATIALGRFLVDTHDLNVFPRRNDLVHDPKTNTTLLNLHAPCGVVKVTVPTTPDGSKADPSRAVSFESVSVPSFDTGIAIEVQLPRKYRWPELRARDSVKADFSYGGTFYCLISAAELGFPGGLAGVDLDAINKATKLLKSAIIGEPSPGAKGSETGLYYFADQQINRSPTGSGVAARVTLAYAKGVLMKGESWTYQSLVSNAFEGKGSFTGSFIEEFGEVDINGNLRPSVRVVVEGFAYYTGFHSFVVEDIDPIGE